MDARILVRDNSLILRRRSTTELTSVSTLQRELTKGTFLPQYRKGRWARIMTAAFPMYALEQGAERYILKHRRCYF